MLKKILSIGVLIFALVSMFGYSYKDQASVINPVIEIEEGQPNNQVIPRYDLIDFQEESGELLSSLLPEQLGNYPIEEDFFLWFYGKYGPDIWDRLLQESVKHSVGVDLWYSLTGNSIHVLWTNYCIDYGICGEDISNVYFKESSSNTGIVMDFVGDVNLDRDLGNTKYMEQVGKGLTPTLGENLLAEVRNADLFVINHEYTYGNGGTPLEGKAFTFQADPNNCKYLHDWGVDLASLANNHTFDYGEEGLLETIKTLKEAEIPIVGAGKNLKEASAVKYFIINGRKIAIVSATQIERTMTYTKEATSTSAGVLKTLSPTKCNQAIVEAKKQADKVIVFVHWGTEGCLAYGYDQTTLGESYIDHGADMVIGAHTHCLEGAQYYKNKLIFYSLGNFWFEWGGPHADEGGVLQVKLDETGNLSAKFLPTFYKEGVSYLITNPIVSRESWDQLENYSSKITIDDSGNILKQTEQEEQNIIKQ